MKTIISVLLVSLFVYSNPIFSQSASFSGLRLEHNYLNGNGRKMLKFNYNITLNGCLGHNIRVYMFVDIPKGKGHKFASGEVMSAISGVLCPSKNYVRFEGGALGIYNDQLNPLPGLNTYYTRLWAKDENTGEWIGHSDFLSYDITGPNNMGSQHSNNQHQNSSPYQSGHSYGVFPDKDGIQYKNNFGTVSLNWHKGLVGNTYNYFYSGTIGAGALLMGFGNRLLEDNNYWIFTDNVVSDLKICIAKDWSHVKAGMGNNLETYNQAISPDEYNILHEREVKLRQQHDPNYNNGFSVGGNSSGNAGTSSSNSSHSSVYTKCTSCNGTGRCSSCNGRGIKFNSYSGHDDSCPSCRGNGSCPICYGRGKL